MMRKGCGLTRGFGNRVDDVIRKLDRDREGRSTVFLFPFCDDDHRSQLDDDDEEGIGADG